MIKNFDKNNSVKLTKRLRFLRISLKNGLIYIGSNMKKKFRRRRIQKLRARFFLKKWKWIKKCRKTYIYNLRLEKKSTLLSK